jgi:hypothetical protein
MDILYSEKADGFCLVSSDSDFTRLATRLREAGKTVYGIGEQRRPMPLYAACDRFIYMEILDESSHMNPIAARLRWPPRAKACQAASPGQEEKDNQENQL